MNDPDPQPDQFAETLAVVGVGLIGGSIAAGLKKRKFPGTILGLGRNPARLAAAQEAGLIDEFTDDIAEAQADFWVFCTPVDRIVSGVLDVKGNPNQTTLVTDAGSVKRPICEGIDGRLRGGVEFIGSHPLAGSEKRGFEHADPDLFSGRLCVLTPDESTSIDQLARLREFWSFLGMRIVEMPAADHDHALAVTSHLPHLIASALASTLDDDHSHLAATGFSDTTRIAAGDPELWSAIFLQNAEGVLSALGKFTDQLETFRRALNQRDGEALKRILKHAKTKRDELE